MEKSKSSNAEIGRYRIPAGLIHCLQSARSVTVLSGAGISADSGIPTFREAQIGLWARYDPQELATPQAFRRDPRLVWQWYAWRKNLVAQAKPNAGHLALAEMEYLLNESHAKFTLITQNIDGLHQRAGSKSIVELHGNINRTKCFDECTLVEEYDNEDGVPPRCPNCGGLLRPDVVWFGENLSAEALKSAWDAAQTCNLFFSIGTSSLVEPAASLPYVALSSGASIIEINPDETILTQRATYVLRGPSGKILPVLIERTWS